MLKGVYEKRESGKTVLEQLVVYYKTLKKCDEMRKYGFNVCTLKDVPFGPEHSCNIPVAIMFHPNMYMYVYVCDGHDDTGIDNLLNFQILCIDETIDLWYK